MASTLDYVDVTITRDIQAVSRVGFGTLLFIGPTDDGNPGQPLQGQKVVEYGDFDAVSAVFSTGDPEYAAAELYFGQEETPDRILIGFWDGTETWPEAIDAIEAIESDWYALATSTSNASDIEAIAGNMATRDKLYLASSADADILDPQVTTDVASTLVDNTYSRTALLYHSDAATTSPEVAWAGGILPKDPGSVTWAYKSLTGVSVDNLNSTERGAIEDKQASYYVSVAGNNITFEGATSELGVFIDIIRAQDWLTYRLSEDIFARLASVDKVPYIGGAAILESLIRTRLDIAVERGVITPNYTVTVPPASQQSAGDRAARVYNNITFEATLTGGVHRVNVRGTLSV